MAPKSTNKLISQELTGNVNTVFSFLIADEKKLSRNSKVFLDGGGLRLFLKCKKAFPAKPGLLKVMLGPFANVATIQSQRRDMMSMKFLSQILDILTSSSKFSGSTPCRRYVDISFIEKRDVYVLLVGQTLQLIR